MILPRLITTIVGLPVLITCIYWGGIPFFCIVGGIIFLGLREFYHMAAEGGYDAQPIVGLCMGAILYISMLWTGIRMGTGSEHMSISFLLTLLLIVFFLRELFARSLRQSVLRISITYFGILYVVWTLGHLCLLRDLRPYGRSYTLFLFLVIWTVDIMSYVIGKKLGRFKCAPLISPGKTIEGTVGGVACGVIAGALLQPIILEKMSLPVVCGLSLGIGVIAQVSDLSESVIKRSFGVKDSSLLLPGHGGILDRFDSLIFTAPLLYYFFLLRG